MTALHDPIREAVYKLDFAARTDRGLVRTSNQDVARVIPRLGLALVADGMGGHEHGGLASSVAAEALVEHFESLDGRGTDIDQSAERLCTAFHAANRRIAEHPSSSAGGTGGAGMGTTLVAAAFVHGSVVIGNIGDSRGYRLRDGALEILTQDHSFAAHLQRIGATSTSEGKEAASRWSHVLTRCVNGDEGVAPDMQTVRYDAGEVYLLCTDGLWGIVGDEEIAAILGSAPDAEEACERLVGAAWAGGGLDNIGVAVVRVVPLQVQPDKPSWSERPAVACDGHPAGDA